jgi:hypothetical protein
MQATNRPVYADDIDVFHRKSRSKTYDSVAKNPMFESLTPASSFTSGTCGHRSRTVGRYVPIVLRMLVR